MIFPNPEQGSGAGGIYFIINMFLQGYQFGAGFSAVGNNHFFSPQYGLEKFLGISF